MKKIAIGYVRVSTSRQAEEGVSLEAQEAKIRAWADFNDYEIGAMYADKGISGASTNKRVGLEDALTYIDGMQGEQPALVVYSLSRLARSTRDTLDISDRLERAGADLVSLSEKIDTTSAAGKMVFRMLAVLAEFERDQISERTSMALAHKKTRGERVGAVPYGMKVAEDGVHIVIDENEQKAIQVARGLAGEGWSNSQIAQGLQGRGYYPRSGDNWHPTQINRILHAE